ncbi:MAG: DUF3617 family protein [Gammaproteobacteria bacterium]
MKLKTSYIVLAFAAAPLPALAASSAPDMSKAINPGLWETTVQMHMTGMPMQPPAQTTRRCVTLVKLKKFNMVPKNKGSDNMNCKVTKSDFSRHVITYTVKCTGKDGSMNMNGESTLDSRNAYHGTINMDGVMEGHPMQMTGTLESKRIGDCQ